MQQESASGASLLTAELQSLVNEVRFASYEDAALRKFLFHVREIILATEDATIDADEHEHQFPGLPLRRLTAAVNSLDFIAPRRVDVVGSFMLKTMVQVRRYY